MKLLQDMIDNHVEVGTNLDKFIKTNSKGMKNQTLDFTSTIIRKYKDPNSNLTNITSLEVAQNLSIYNCKEDLKLIWFRISAPSSPSTTPPCGTGIFGPCWASSGSGRWFPTSSGRAPRYASAMTETNGIGKLLFVLPFEVFYHGGADFGTDFGACEWISPIVKSRVPWSDLKFGPGLCRIPSALH